MLDSAFIMSSPGRDTGSLNPASKPRLPSPDSRVAPALCGASMAILGSSQGDIRHTVDDKKSCNTHNKEYAIIPVVSGPKVMQDLDHQQYLRPS